MIRGTSVMGMLVCLAALDSTADDRFTEKIRKGVKLWH